MGILEWILVLLGVIALIPSVIVVGVIGAVAVGFVILVVGIMVLEWIERLQKKTTTKHRP